MSLTVSVIIPVYKRVELLDACVRSCMRSTVPPCEVIIVDDGNSAADAAEISRIASLHAAKLIRCDSNGGAPRARNKGAAAAHGDALFFADADIELESHALELLTAALVKSSDVSFTYGDYELESHTMRAQEFSVQSLRKNNYISSMSLVRKEVFPGFDESLRRFQDWDLWLTIVQHGGTGVYVPTTVCRIMASGTISTWLPSFIVKNLRWFSWIPQVKKYLSAREIIERKHQL